jgi:hypothetical protein
MIIALFVFALAGLLVSVTPGAAVGYAFVAVTGRLPLVSRVAGLVALATGSAVAWLAIIGPGNVFRPAVMVLSFAGTLGSGCAFLAREASKRRAARRPAPVWPGWTP